MKTFCQTCGTANEYAAVRPNFCFSCGSKMGGSTASAPPPQPQRPAYQAKSEEEWIEDYADLIDPKDLRFSTRASARGPVKIGDLVHEKPGEWTEARDAGPDLQHFLENTVRKTNKIDLDAE